MTMFNLARFSSFDLADCGTMPVQTGCHLEQVCWLATLYVTWRPVIFETALIQKQGGILPSRWSGVTKVDRSHFTSHVISSGERKHSWRVIYVHARSLSVCTSSALLQSWLRNQFCVPAYHETSSVFPLTMKPVLCSSLP